MKKHTKLFTQILLGFSILFMISVFIGCGQSKSTLNNVSNDNITVYVTKTGKKYHSNDCIYLSKSKISITLKEAKEEGYTPCSKCNPPQ